MSGAAQPPRLDGGAAPSALSWIAAAIILGMAVLLWADVLFRSRLVGTIGSSGYSTTAGLVISAVTLPVALGLWLRRPWAWWAGLIAAAWQLISHLLYIVVTTASGEKVGLVGWLIPVLLIAFLTVLLLPATRRTCLQHAGDVQ